MTSTVQKVESLAASGTDNVVIQVNSGAQSLSIGVAAKYAAVSATASGIQAAFQVSVDGSTYNNAAESNLVVAPAATVVGYGEKKVFVEGPLKLDDQPVAYVKINLTNLDGSNAASVAVLSEQSDVI